MSEILGSFKKGISGDAQTASFGIGQNPNSALAISAENKAANGHHEGVVAYYLH